MRPALAVAIESTKTALQIIMLKYKASLCASSRASRCSDLYQQSRMLSRGCHSEQRERYLGGLRGVSTTRNCRSALPGLLSRLQAPERIKCLRCSRHMWCLIDPLFFKALSMLQEAAEYFEAWQLLLTHSCTALACQHRFAGTAHRAPDLTSCRLLPAAQPVHPWPASGARTK